jgi:ectoine hydroxylase-related dioxygenase (phytanoyl-CoA dioxygenase family)
VRDLCTSGANDERIERFVRQTSEHEGIPLQVLEMTGEPGDVFMTHSWLLHNASMNSSDRMRRVVTERLFSPVPAWLIQADPE